jgi:hypothetical protein
VSNRSVVKSAVKGRHVMSGSVWQAFGLLLLIAGEGNKEK